MALIFGRLWTWKFLSIFQQLLIYIHCKQNVLSNLKLFPRTLFEEMKSRIQCLSERKESTIYGRNSTLQKIPKFHLIFSARKFSINCFQRLWVICSKLSGNCPLTENFFTREIGQIFVFYASLLSEILLNSIV